MKTTIYILTALFMLNITTLSAENPKIVVKVNGTIFSISFINDYTELAPVTPKEAFFNDLDPRPSADIIRLSPITPKEATFDEINAETGILSMNPILLKKISPVAPKEAEFEESASEAVNRYNILAPTTPVAAAFEE